MGTRIAVMNEGLLQQVGSPQALYDTPINRFVAGFIGSPSMNFVEVHMEGSGESARLVGPATGRSRCPTAIATQPRRGRARRSWPVSGRSTSTSASPVPASARSRLERTSSSTSATRSCSTSAPPTRTSSAIVGSEHRVRPGDIVNLVLPLDKLHLFDGETGLTLAPDIAVVA